MDIVYIAPALAAARLLVDTFQFLCSFRGLAARIEYLATEASEFAKLLTNLRDVLAGDSDLDDNLDVQLWNTVRQTGEACREYRKLLMKIAESKFKLVKWKQHEADISERRHRMESVKTSLILAIAVKHLKYVDPLTP